MTTRVVLVFAVILGASCGGHVVTACPADLRTGLAPADTTISPGDQFQTRVTLLGCGGTQVLTDTLTWISSDLSIAVVGAHTGVVIGARSGTATITATGKQYGHIGDAHVAVR